MERHPKVKFNADEHIRKFTFFCIYFCVIVMQMLFHYHHHQLFISWFVQIVFFLFDSILLQIINKLRLIPTLKLDSPNQGVPLPSQ